MKSKEFINTSAFRPTCITNSDNINIIISLLPSYLTSIKLPIIFYGWVHNCKTGSNIFES